MFTFYPPMTSFPPQTRLQLIEIAQLLLKFLKFGIEFVEFLLQHNSPRLNGFAFNVSPQISLIKRMTMLSPLNHKRRRDREKERRGGIEEKRGRINLVYKRSQFNHLVEYLVHLRSFLFNFELLHDDTDTSTHLGVVHHLVEGIRIKWRERGDRFYLVVVLVSYPKHIRLDKCMQGFFIPIEGSIEQL